MKKSFLVVVLHLSFFACPLIAAEDFVLKTSTKSVEDVTSALKKAITNAGAQVFAEIDHAASAKAAGIELQPTILIIFGNPKIGTQIIQQDRRVGLQLPLHVLVWNDNGSTKISYENPTVISNRYNIKSDDENLQKLVIAVAKLTDASL